MYNELFKDLSVDDAVKRGEIDYGRYIVLRFDFSSLHDRDEPASEYINRTLSKFVRRLEEYPDLDLDMTALDSSRFDDPDSAVDNFINVVNEVHDALSSARDAPCSTMFSDVKGVCHYYIRCASS